MESLSSVQQQEQRQKLYGKRQKGIINGDVRGTRCTVLSCFAVMTKKGEKITVMADTRSNSQGVALFINVP